MTKNFKLIALLIFFMSQCTITLADNEDTADVAGIVEASTSDEGCADCGASNAHRATNEKILQ